MGANSVKPSELWKPFEPGREQPWSRRLAAHLFRRAGFGATLEEVVAAEKMHPAEVIESIFQSENPDFASRMQTLERQAKAVGSVERLPNIWLYRMVKTSTQLLEKATLFWHGHFATSAQKVDDVGLMIGQNHLLRQNAIGKFGPMVHAISRDPAMLTYLDSRENRKTRPNENYARELMELFCLGLGNYSETDIKQIARTFTGWEIKKNRFRFNPYQHDQGLKSFLGESGNFDGDQAVEIVLKQKSSTKFIAKKLINFFVTDLPVSDAVAQPIADHLSRNDFDIGKTLRLILGSCYFMDSVGNKIKSPIELGIGFLRCLEATGNFVSLSNRMRELGQLPFFPPNVKGWPGGRTWINSASLLGRVNMIGDLLRDEKTKWAHNDLRGLVTHYNAGSISEVVEFLETLFLAKPLTPASRKNLHSLSGKKLNNEVLTQVVYAFCALPEFQLG